MRSRTLLRSLPVGLIATVATLASTAAAAHANGFLTTAEQCGAESSSQVFLPWADPADYTLAPGGDFASGGPAWSLSGGAQVVAGGDGYNLTGNGASANSLSLPDGSSATSPSMCVSLQNPDLRFFAENSGSANDTLQVSVTFETSLGNLVTQPIGQFAATGTWEPMVQDPIAVSLVQLMPNDGTPVSFTFAPQGQGGNWQVDDVYVDPWNTCC
jgi:hypothetical protein